MQPDTYKSGSYLSPSQQAAAEKSKQQSKAADDRKTTEVDNTKSREDIQYTLFVSGLRNGRASELESKNSTDNLALIFDSVERHSYNKSYNKTSYSVESKSKASDNVVTQDGKFSFTGRVTDSPYILDRRNFIDKDTDKDKPLKSKRPGKAIDFIRSIADAHMIVTLVTEDDILENYVITDFTAERTVDEGAGITISLSLEEFRFKNVSKTVLARTTDPKKAGKKNSGTKQTADGGAADDAAKKKKSPYLGPSQGRYERTETAIIGTTDYDSGRPGAQIKPSGPTFDPGSLLRK